MSWSDFVGSEWVTTVGNLVGVYCALLAVAIVVSMFRGSEGSV